MTRFFAPSGAAVVSVGIGGRAYAVEDGAVEVDDATDRADLERLGWTATPATTVADPAPPAPEEADDANH